ncbi:IMP dehydrogenase [Candidatus Woesearchaeota archaeon]|nr:IMP dehydrogenase [Candidatus Woesearchaeota archaeon]
MSKKEFFREMGRTALTFDDVRLQTGYSRVPPQQVNLESKFSRNIPLKIPLVSAAMDTVTEYQMAIALAMEGGLGILHRNLSKKEQAKQVARVKNRLNALNGLKDKPITVQEEMTIEQILQMKHRKDFHFDSFPVLDENRKLVGILTGNDFDLCDDYTLTAKAVMKTDLITVPTGTPFEKAYELMKKESKKAIPIINKTGELVGLYVHKDLKAIKDGTAKKYNVDNKGNLRVGAAVGVGEDAFERCELLLQKGVDVIVIDTAHSDTLSAIQTVEELKRKYSVDLVVGNISQPESARRLINAGADGIKVGQGGGSICTTRVVSGYGRPQVTAIYCCAELARQFDIPVCADGGLRYSGDIPIAIGAGAHSVMMGKLFAGTDEAPEDIIYYQGRQWKKFRGMGSMSAMRESKGSRDRYNQSEKEEDLVPEGVDTLVPYKGSLHATIVQHLGGLRSGMGAVGAANIEELQQKADFDRITQSGQTESHPHDVHIIEEAPNYSPGR